MNRLQNLTQKQIYAVVVGILLSAVIAAGVFLYLVLQKDKAEESEGTPEEEMREEYENLLEETSNFGPTDDPQLQQEQLEILRRQQELGVELGEEEPPPSEEQQQEELQKLREQEQR